MNLDLALTCQGMDTGPLGVSGTRVLAGCEMGPPWNGHSLAGPNGCLIESGSGEFGEILQHPELFVMLLRSFQSSFCGVSE